MRDVDSIQALGHGLGFILGNPIPGVEWLADLFERETVDESMPYFKKGCGGRGVFRGSVFLMQGEVPIPNKVGEGMNRDAHKRLDLFTFGRVPRVRIKIAVNNSERWRILCYWDEPKCQGKTI